VGAPSDLDVVAEGSVVECADAAGAGRVKYRLEHAWAECGNTAGEAPAAVAGMKRIVGNLGATLGRMEVRGYTLDELALDAAVEEARAMCRTWRLRIRV